LIPTIAGLAWWLRTPQGRAIFDWAQLRLPVLGHLIAKYIESRAFRAFGMLIDAGVQINDALLLVCNTSSNVWYQRLWSRAEQDIKDGQRLVTPLAQSNLLREPVVQMIDCGERSGRLGPVFMRLAEFTEREYEQAITTTSQLLEPAMILVMGSIIGFVAIAVLLPIFGSASVMAK